MPAYPACANPLRHYPFTFRLRTTGNYLTPTCAIWFEPHEWLKPLSSASLPMQSMLVEGQPLSLGAVPALVRLHEEIAQIRSKYCNLHCNGTIISIYSTYFLHLVGAIAKTTLIVWRQGDRGETAGLRCPRGVGRSQLRGLPSSSSPLLNFHLTLQYAGRLIFLHGSADFTSSSATIYLNLIQVLELMCFLSISPHFARSTPSRRSSSFEDGHSIFSS